MANPDYKTAEPRMDAASLYREEVFTDRRVGTIRRLVPVKSDGSPDDKRKVLFVGQAQLLTPVGALPLAFEIEAGSLAEAVERFASAAKTAVERALKELKELQREAASSIVIPEPGYGGFGPGNIPGGGKIQLR